MKTIIIVSYLVGLIICAPSKKVHEPSDLQRLPAVRHEEVHDEYGQYALRYITAENTVVSERRRLVPSNNGGYVLEIEGKYQFIGDDGKLYVTEFRGGPDGFHVGGNHLRFFFCSEWPFPTDSNPI